MCVGYQKFQAGSPYGCLDFGVISPVASSPLIEKNQNKSEKACDITFHTVNSFHLFILSCPKILLDKFV